MRGANIGEAFRRVWARPWLLAALTLTNVGLAMLLAAPLWAMLADLIDLRPAATAMMAGDDGLALELILDHHVFVLAALSAGLGVVLYGLFCWILDGGVLAALALDGDQRALGAAQVLAESARRAGRMIKLGLFGLLLRVIPAVIGGVAYGIAHAVITGRTFQPNLNSALVTLAIGAVAWTAVSMAIDYARGLSLDDPQTRSWRLVGRGLKLVFQRRSATLQLIAFSMAAWLAIGVVYWLGAGHLGAIALLAILRLLATTARAAITMTTLTAAARVARA